MKKEFTVMIGSVEITGTLRECQQAFVDYRNVRSKQGLGARSMHKYDGLVYRGGAVTGVAFEVKGHFSYNSRFWRTDTMGTRV